MSTSLAPGSRTEPLAARMRPVRLADIAGQDHILAPGRPLHASLSAGHLHSLLLWGPPGTGKTTMAKVFASVLDMEFVSLSAVLSGVRDIRAAAALAAQQLASGRRTLLFMDEVHRFNKSQQDAFLPHVEDGTFLFIGATTENPAFELRSALLSRCRIYKLKSLDEAALGQVLQRVLAEDPVWQERSLAEDARQLLLAQADGDARRLLNLLEVAGDLIAEDRLLTADMVREAGAGDLRRFDRQGDIFYEQISALHKSVRGSDPDAGLYWLARMLDGGCDPLYIARRLLRMASEDTGNADPRALSLCAAAWDVVERLGEPEGNLALAQAVVYLAVAAKSNAVYRAFNAAMELVRTSPSHEVPVHLRNAPRDLMKQMGYGRDYRYAHDEPHGYAAGENYFPEPLAGSRFYFPVDRGLESRVLEKLAFLRSLDAERAGTREQKN